MARHQLVGLLWGLCAGVGCGSTSNDDVDSATKGTSSVQTANTSTSQAVSTSATSATATTTSSATTAGGNGNGGNGNGGTGTDGTSAAETTGVGGGAGNANASSETTTTAGGSGGDDGGPCPSEPPSPDESCANAGEHCAYEDCAGVGRTAATCVSGAWSVTTSACGETVYCSAGGAECSKGEICLILAGGAFEQACVPNTCETGPVGCDCIEGCSGECATYGNADTDITITCSTCPPGFACP